MANPIKRVGIVSKPKKSEIREIVPALLQWLHERDIETFIDKEMKDKRENDPSRFSHIYNGALLSCIIPSFIGIV